MLCKDGEERRGGRADEDMRPSPASTRWADAACVDVDRPAPESLTTKYAHVSPGLSSLEHVKMSSVREPAGMRTRKVCSPTATNRKPPRWSTCAVRYIGTADSGAAPGGGGGGGGVGVLGGSGMSVDTDRPYE